MKKVVGPFHIDYLKTINKYTDQTKELSNASYMDARKITAGNYMTYSSDNRDKALTTSGLRLRVGEKMKTKKKHESIYNVTIAFFYDSRNARGVQLR